MGVTQKIAVLAAILPSLFACSSEDDAPARELKEQEVIKTDAQSGAEAYYLENVLPIVMASSGCISCHTAKGVASGTDLVFVNNTHDDFLMLEHFVRDGDEIQAKYKLTPEENELYFRANGGDAHLGGDVLLTAEMENIFKTFIQSVNNAAPVASITTDVVTGQAPLKVKFTASGVTDVDSPDQSLFTYVWNFGEDDTQVTRQTTSIDYTFNTAGTYTVTLVVKDELNASSSITKVITVTPGSSQNVAPVARFSATPEVGLIPLNVNFDGSASTDSDGMIQSYDWDFGDTTTAIGSNVSHSYTASGEYTISLTVQDDASATHSVTKKITATTAPVASFTSAEVSGELYTFAFDASASTDDFSLQSYAWDFGDGSSSSSKVATHAYNDAGEYTVQLTVTDNHGFSSTISKTVMAQSCTPTETYFKNNVYSELKTETCLTCHVKAGVADLLGSKLLFVSDSTVGLEQASLESYQATLAFLGSKANAASILLDTPSEQNGIKHTGTKLITATDPLYLNLEELVKRVQAPDVCYQ